MGTLTGWTPETPAAAWEPVQVEDATGGLTGCEMPDGRGLLTWPLGANVRAAVVSEPDAWLADGVVDSGDIFTAVAGGDGTVHRCSCFSTGGEVYLTVVRSSGVTGYSEIYKADNPSNPAAGFSFHGTVQTGLASFGTGFGGNYTAGIPTVLSGGRWVILVTYWNSGSLGGSDYSGRMLAAYYSDDSGASWTLALDQGYGSPSPTTPVVTSQIGLDTATGALLWMSGDTGSNARRLNRSTDNGVSYSVTATSFGDGIIVQGAIDNGTDLYGLRIQAVTFTDATWMELTGTGTSIGDWTSTGLSWVPPGEAASSFQTTKAVVAAGSVYIFCDEQVFGTPGPRWNVGRVAWGGANRWH